jgi:hypothetical protein
MIKEEEEERPSTDSSLEELASWARGLGKKSTKTTLSTKHRKRTSDPRALSMTRDSMASIRTAVFGESSSKPLVDSEKPSPLDSFRSPVLDNFTSEAPTPSLTRRATNEAPWNPDVILRPRNRLNFSASEPSPAAISRRDDSSSSFASRVQAATSTSLPGTSTSTREGRSTSFASRGVASVPRSPNENPRRQDRAVSDPEYPYFRPDDITGNTAPAANVNGPVDLAAAQFSGPLTPRTLEELSEEEQINIAIMESMKSAPAEAKYRYR